MGRVTMNPTALTTAAGDLATKWRRFAAATIVPPVAVAAHLRTLTDPHLLPARCRLFRRGHVLVVSRSLVLRARDHVEVWPDKYLERLSGKLLDHLNHLFVIPAPQLSFPRRRESSVGVLSSCPL
ncbi:MAG: hypothetical protein ABSG75_17735 [Syntrophales bacterium]